MIFKRHIVNHLKKISKEFKCLLLTGPRQVGKSLIMTDFFTEYNYLTFDDEILRARTLKEPGLFFIDNKIPLILDEVQYITNLFPYIKIECDKKSVPEYGKFILTGSQSFRLMKNVSESLAGRIAIKNLLGLSRREIMQDDFDLPFIPNDVYISNRQKCLFNDKNIWNLIYKGSFPELYKKETDWETFYSSYLQTYIERDVNDLINVKDKSQFINFMIAVAARTGQVLNYSNIASEVGVTVATIKSWISILESSNIIYLLKPLTNSALNRIIKSPKLYFVDTGLVCYLTKNNTEDIAKNSIMSGALYETYIVIEIIKSFINAGLDPSFYIFYYRGKDKIKVEDDVKEKEIDVVIDYQNTLYPIEIKKTANPNESMISANKVFKMIKNKKIGNSIIICSYNEKINFDTDVFSLPYSYI